MERPGRTMVGLSGLPIGECARYVADWLRGKASPSPRDGFSAPLVLRFAVDDLKAYSLEGAAAGTAKPSSLQLTDWFWNETATGAAIHVDEVRVHPNKLTMRFIGRTVSEVSGTPVRCNARMIQHCLSNQTLFRHD